MVAHQLDEHPPEPQLRDYVQVLRRRKWTVVLVASFVAGFTIAVTLFQTPVYEATAEVLLQASTTESIFDPSTGQRLDRTRIVQTEIALLRSQPVKDAVLEAIGRVPKITVSPAGDTDVIQVRSEDTDAFRAAEAATAHAKAYIAFRRKQAVDDVLAAAQEIQGSVRTLQGQIDATAPGAQRDALVDQQALFNQKLNELQVSAALRTGGAQLVTEALPPRSPVRPRPVRTAILASFVGLMLGVGLAFLRDHLDDSVTTKDDLRRIAPRVPVLGLIPVVAGWKPGDGPRVVAVDDSGAPAAEAYRALRTSIQFLALDRPIRTLQITSASAGEGKTTTLANLATALAGAGQRVVVVCCDLRRPRIHEFFGLSNSTGFTSVLLGQVPLTAAVQPVPSQPGLSVLSSGPIPPNPSELLSSQRTVEVLTTLQANADIVLVDCPPLLPVTDSLVLSGRVDGTVLVAVSNGSARKDVARAVELLEQVEAPFLGTVLNGVVSGSDAYNTYYRQEVATKSRGWEVPKATETVDGRRRTRNR